MNINTGRGRLLGARQCGGETGGGNSYTGQRRQGLGSVGSRGQNPGKVTRCRDVISRQRTNVACMHERGPRTCAKYLRNSPINKRGSISMPDQNSGAEKSGCLCINCHMATGGSLHSWGLFGGLERTPVWRRRLEHTNHLSKCKSPRSLRDAFSFSRQQQERGRRTTN